MPLESLSAPITLLLHFSFTLKGHFLMPFVHMRTFSSYGPVDPELHFSVPRPELVDQCTEQLLGHPQKGGHYFTIWASRQTGKTWLMRQVAARIRQDYPEDYIVATMSMESVSMEDTELAERFLERVPLLFSDTFDLEIPPPKSWGEFRNAFHKKRGVFDKPVILFIDEFDSLPSKVIDAVVRAFRSLYLDRENNFLHALALIGVRSVLGFSSDRGSPFNIQRSLEVPRFTHEEVLDLYRQYQEESGQSIDPQVVEAVWKATRGQPGLTCWFGELLTEKYNPDPTQPLDYRAWKTVYRKALCVEPNNTILNMVAKARGKYKKYLMKMFTVSNVPFHIHQPWCNYLHLNGLLDSEKQVDDRGEDIEVCRFSSPFIQESICNALRDDLVNAPANLLPLDPFDDISDVYQGPKLELPALLRRYVEYLDRLQAKGINPWKGQPTRSDLRITEAVGHFHLYWWLMEAIGRKVIISPEFPTGNGKVDLHLQRDQKRGLIEIKVFTTLDALPDYREQAARYAGQVGLQEATLAIFVPGIGQEAGERLSGSEVCNGIQINVVAIGCLIE
jgi:hypothetical protein